MCASVLSPVENSHKFKNLRDVYFFALYNCYVLNNAIQQFHQNMSVQNTINYSCHISKMCRVQAGRRDLLQEYHSSDWYNLQRLY